MSRLAAAVYWFPPQATAMTESSHQKNVWSSPALPGSTVWEAVERLLASGRRLSLVTTGGGSRAVTWLLDHPGASAAVVEVCIPYDGAAVDAYLGRLGPHRVTAETARQLACRAWGRLVGLGGKPAVSLGAGCTAALTTARLRRGGDRAHVACRSGGEYVLADLVFDRHHSTRQQQEGVLSAALLAAMSRAAGQGAGDLLPLPDWAALTERVLPVHRDLEDLLEGRRQVLWWGGQGRAPAASGELLLVPGSFNPLHRGHLELAAAAASRSGRVAALELSVENVDKPTLEYGEVLRRLEGVQGRLPVALTRAPTFPDKARHFPGAWYAVGFDTAVRLLEPRYYGESEGTVDWALARLSDLGAHFVVAGRAVEGRFSTAADLPVPAGRSRLFTGLSEAEFRVDISSSELRSGASPRSDSHVTDDEEDS